MSRKASSQDKAACEGFFGRLKKEFFYPLDWRAFTLVQFIDEVDAYIRGHNEMRIKMSLGGQKPDRMPLKPRPYDLNTVQVFVRSPRRLWRKIHITVDEEVLKILALEVISSAIGDAPILPDLLDQIALQEAIT